MPIPDVPVVMPSGDAEGTQRRATARRSVGKVARVLLVVPLLGLAAFFLFRGEGGTEPIAPDGFHPAAGPADPGATGVDRRADFERLRTSLSESLAAYSDRRAEFDLGRVDCAALAAAHRTAQRDFIRLSNQVARQDGGLAASQREAWRELVAETSAMDGNFQGSGCDTATQSGGEG